MFNIQTLRNGTPTAVKQWVGAVRAAGGGFENNSIFIAANLVRVLQSRPYYSKIKYVLPLLGTGINAARVPLVDALGVGAATNVSFVDANFSQSTGLQGNGSSKYLNCLIKPAQLGSSNNGGLGYWENNINLSGNVEVIGCYNTTGTSNRYVIDLRTNIRSFRWGAPANGAGDSSTPTNGHFYGQRSSATSRQLFFNGASVGTNTTSDDTVNPNENNMYIVGSNEAGVPYPWPGRCALAYLTDGTLSTEDVVDLDTIFRKYLMTPTGRPTS